MIEPDTGQTTPDLIHALRAIIPGASWDYDNDGQIVVYTGLAVGDDDFITDHKPYQHYADGTPTSEFCPGLDDCPDCIDVLTQAAESLDPGVHYALNGHTLLVHDDHTYSVLTDADEQAQ